LPACLLQKHLLLILRVCADLNIKSTGAKPGGKEVSNKVLAVAVVLASVAIICILVSTMAVLLLRRTVDKHALHSAIYSSDASSDVGRAFPIGPGAPSLLSLLIHACTH
jgi:hypothetical protein